MAKLKRLVPTHELRTSFVREAASKGRLFVHHDKASDLLVILLVPPDTPTAVHYIDQYVGLLYQPDNLEVVGLQVEAFEKSFVPRHASVERAWRLSDSCELEDFGDIQRAFETQAPHLATEIARTVEEVAEFSMREIVLAFEEAPTY